MSLVPVRVQVGLRPAGEQPARNYSSLQDLLSFRPADASAAALPPALFFSPVYSASIRYFPLARAFIALRTPRSEGNLRSCGGKMDGGLSRAQRCYECRRNQSLREVRASNPGSVSPDSNYRSRARRTGVLLAGNCRVECRAKSTVPSARKMR